MAHEKQHPNIQILGFGDVDQGLGAMYRVESQRVSSGYTDESGEYVSSGKGYSRLYAYQFPVLKLTKCGKWIRDASGERRFILNTSNKRYACETLELAVMSFKARRERQISILKARLRAAEQELALARADSGNAPVTGTWLRPALATASA
jgi:hypothetical protein